MAGLCLLLAACSGRDSGVAVFLPLEYEGIPDARAEAGQYRNPILPGFYPDPSICRVGDDFWMVNSSFGYFPGLPVWHSTDLVHWEQCGSALENNEEFWLGNQNIIIGTFAPTIRYNPGNGLYYIVCTFMGGYGNFFVTTDDPLKGEWSSPTRLPEVKGIDPSILFDDDGRAYITSACGVDAIGEKKLYRSDNVILLWDFDWKNGRTEGPYRALMRHGVHPEQEPAALEGPHIYHVGDRYFLMCAEGGTEAGHSEVVFVSDSPYGPFEACPVNPILTQRDFHDGEAGWINCTGHADLVQSADGQWYAVFLGVQPYEGDYCFFTGRQTVMLPASWDNGQLIILPAGERVPQAVNLTDDLRRLAEANTIAGFDPHNPGALWNGRDGLSSHAVFIRNPVSECTEDGASVKEDFNLRNGSLEGPFWRIDRRGRLHLSPKAVGLGSLGNPSAICCRITSRRFSAGTRMEFAPEDSASRAGIFCWYNENGYMSMYKTLDSLGKTMMVAEAVKGGEVTERFELPLEGREALVPLHLKVEADAPGGFLFSISADGRNWKPVGQPLDPHVLDNPDIWGFTGAVVGIYSF